MVLLAGCIVFFYFDEGEGLSILWFSEFQKLEKNDEGKMELEDEDDLFKTPISLFCSEIIYCYYGEEEDNPDDIKEWDYENELEENIKGDFRIPEFIQLVFKWDEEDLERTVTLPIKRISPSGLKEEPK